MPPWSTHGSTSDGVQTGTGARSSLAAGGQYRFYIQRRDEAGDIARQGIRVSLDGTPGSPTAAPITCSPKGDGTRDATSLGFELIRRAAVTFHVRSGDELVRTLDLGALAAGAHSASWDGKTGSGTYLVGGRPTCTVTAFSALGENSVSRGLVIDLSRPRPYTAGGKTARPDTTTHLSFEVVDPFSAKAYVRCVVTDAKGRTLASGHRGWGSPTARPTRAATARRAPRGPSSPFASRSQARTSGSRSAAARTPCPAAARRA